MKLNAEIDSQAHVVEIRREGNRTFAKVDDREYELEVSQPEPGVFLFKHQGRVYEALIPFRSDENAAFEVEIHGNRHEVSVSDPKRLKGSGREQSHDHGHAEIRSAMPGKVVRLLAVAGQQVEKGDGIVVVEAMKMQNEIKAPKGGSVRSVNVTEGSTVNAGEILVVIE